MMFQPFGIRSIVEVDVFDNSIGLDLMVMCFLVKLLPLLHSLPFVHVNIIFANYLKLSCHLGVNTVI